MRRRVVVQVHLELPVLAQAAQHVLHLQEEVDGVLVEDQVLDVRVRDRLLLGRLRAREYDEARREHLWYGRDGDPAIHAQLDEARSLHRRQRAAACGPCALAAAHHQLGRDGGASRAAALCDGLRVGLGDGSARAVRAEPRQRSAQSLGLHRRLALRDGRARVDDPVLPRLEEVEHEHVGCEQVHVAVDLADMLQGGADELARAADVAVVRLSALLQVLAQPLWVAVVHLRVQLTERRLRPLPGLDLKVQLLCNLLPVLAPHVVRNGPLPDDLPLHQAAHLLRDGVESVQTGI